MEWQRERGDPLIEEIKKLHASMGLDYRFPDLDGPLIEAKAIVHDEHTGVVLGAGAIKRVGEAFLWLDIHASTRQKVKAIRALNKIMVDAGKVLTLEEITAWIPAELEPQFAHMLGSLGWQKSPWPTWTKLL